MYKILGLLISLIPIKKMHDAVDQWRFNHSTQPTVALRMQDKQFLNDLINQNPIADNHYFIPGFNYHVAKKTILFACMRQKKISSLDQDDHLRKIQSKMAVPADCRAAVDFFAAMHRDAYQLKEEANKRVKRSNQDYIQYQRNIHNMYLSTNKFSEQLRRK